MVARTLAFIVVVALATPAHAVRCRQWIRQSATQQEQTLTQMIEASPRHPALRGRRVNGARLQMCLERSRRWIEADFSEACSRGQRESLGVLDEIFRQYVLSCTNARP